jgi:hypothetical protein
MFGDNDLFGGRIIAYIASVIGAIAKKNVLL